MLDHSSPSASSFRSEFDLPRDVCYLNAAYMTPQPKRALQAAIEGAKRRAKSWQLSSKDFFDDVEDLRKRFARLVRCSAENIAVVPSASYGVSTAAKNLKVVSGDKILILKDQFPSNYYPWQRLVERTGAELCVVSKSNGQSWSSAILRDLESNAKNVRIAALPAHHWATGETINLEEVSAVLHGMGAHLVLDLTQTVGAYPFCISDFRPDFVVVSGYKWLFCPYGVSFMYVADAHLNGTPIEETWIGRYGSENFSALADYTELYQPGARRYDVGEPASFSNISSAIAALDSLERWGINTISNKLAETNQEIKKICAVNGFETLSSNCRAPHFQSVRLPLGNTAKIARSLAGHGVYVSHRGDRIRIAPHLYTDQYDLDRLAQLLPFAVRDSL